MVIKSKRLRVLLFSYVNIIVILIFFIIGVFVGTEWSVAKKAAYLIRTKMGYEVTSEEIDFSTYWDVWDAIQDRHVDRPIDEKSLFYGSLMGLAAATGDPYSNFFDPEMTELFNQEISGTFEGVGIEIGLKDNQIVVISPLKDTPADQAGVEAKDVIIKIDDSDANNLTLDEAVNLIRGEKGTTVELTVARAGYKEPLAIEIIRDTIRVQSVSYEKLDSGIAYVELTMFNNDTVKEFAAITNQIVLDKPTGIVLDLRNNPGGYFDVAIDVAGLFIDQEVVVIEEQPGEEQQEYYSDQSAGLIDYPLVVIVNGGSASAAEIVAGALQDHGVATVVGEKTFGKGSVQEIETFADGSSLKLTVAKWLTPSGSSIQDNGITPDIEIELTEDHYNNDIDPQLDKSIELITSQ